nr:beta-ketoacyl synthase N-terminal-like domain-containing protein [uncultured Desulfobacter sp.]
MNDGVLITGMSCVTSAGLDKQMLLDAITQQRFCLKAEYGGAGGRKITNAGLIDRLSPALENYENSAGSSKNLALFVHAAQQAMEDAGIWVNGCSRSALPFDSPFSDRLKTESFPVVLGSNYGFPVPYMDLFSVRDKKNKSLEDSAMQPMYKLHFREDMITMALQKHLGIGIEKICANMQCTSGLFSIMIAASRIKNGEVDVALAGGYDLFESSTYWVLRMAGLIDPNRATPFDQNHNGFNYGEGIGFLVLESEAAARKRGVTAGYGKLRSCAVNCSPSDGTPSVSAIAKTIEQALRQAGLEREDVDFISPHGCGIPDMDNVESSALKRFFGDAAARIPMANYTPYIGYSFAASGITDLIAILYGLKKDAVLPGFSPEKPNELSDFNFFSSPAPSDSVQNILKLKMGYSGAVVAMIISACENNGTQSGGK